MAKASPPNFHPTIRTEFVNYLNWKRAELIRYQAKQFVFVVQLDSARHKLLQVGFLTDGSLYVDFPYFDNANGIVSLATLSELSASTTIELTETGKVTTNKVKFSHHVSGDVQFSKTGKVKTEIKKKALPLNKTYGHIFTFHAQGLQHFQVDPKAEDIAPTLERTELSFRFEGVNPNAVKLVGRWYESKQFMSRSRGSSFGPIVVTEAPDGRRSKMFLIGPPETSPLHDYVLGVTCEELPMMDRTQDSVMLFIGGFSALRDSGIYQRPTFLCASYPIVDPDELKHRIGSIDLDR